MKAATVDTPVRSHYDYIIVGAGSAGCVLANRLTANPEVTVCLLEAGPPDNSPLIRVPAGILALMWDPRHNWKYYTDPEPYLNNRQLYCPRGKVLGGSSAINAMCFTRGLPRDFDRWSAYGIEGWNWNDLLPHYLATQQQLRADMNPAFHGYHGEQLVADVKQVNSLSLDFIAAAVESGLALRNDDFNGPNIEGVGVYQTFQDGHSRRVSSAHAFLHPVKNRPNLTVVTRATVDKILFNETAATGVQCRIGGGWRHTSVDLRANKEVLLSAGSINSPKLLMLSGVGDSTELNRHGISVVHDLPGVGRNLHDHLDVIINTQAKLFKGMGLSLASACKLPSTLLQYFTNRTGYLACNGAEAGGFVKSDPNLPYPDMQLHFAPILLERHSVRSYGHGFSLHICNLQPKSRGSVTLRSSDPTANPRIRFNYCEHPADLDAMVEAVKLGRRILSAPSLGKSSKVEHSPGDHVQSDDQIRAYVKDKAETIYHPVGTCRMGADRGAVVDGKLRVHGVRKLRVIDASIMPSINSGNTHATVIAIANKAASHILADGNPSP